MSAIGLYSNRLALDRPLSPENSPFALISWGQLEKKLCTVPAGLMSRAKIPYRVRVF